MPIIGLDGASAVGKTSTSAMLASKYGAFHIPEVNTWWKRPDNEYPEWFFERQADRWSIAQEKSSLHKLVVIDIDLFQPLWYCWSFDFTLFGGQTLEFIRDYFRNLILNREIGFPDKYFILHTNKDNLRTRKKMDQTRQRRGFEMNLRIIEPLEQYFRALNNFIPGLVCFINSEDIEGNAQEIVRQLPSNRSDHTYSVELFDYIVNWLGQNKAMTNKEFV